MKPIEMRSLTAQVPAELVDALAERARANDNSIAAEVRRAIRAYVQDDRPVKRAA